MARIMIGSKVKHDFSKVVGVVKAYRRDPDGYNYQVEFYQYSPLPTILEWYQRKVLRLL